MSDKTTAALAAEQADAEATTTQEAELLPAATLDELEQVDLGTVAEGERAPFRITDDRCADWAIRKIADERSEYDRLKALADEQIAAINEKVAAARKRMENGTSYLTSCLADFFATVPHKETKTTEKYRLLSGTLTFKKGTTKTKLDETKLVPWLKANGYGELVKVEESTRWADLKKLLSYSYTLRMQVVKGQKKVIGRYLNTRTPGGPYSERSHNILMGTGNTKAGGVSAIPFQRMSRTRTDIKKFTTISVPSMITSERTNEKIMTRLQEETAKRLQHNLDRALGK